MRKQFAKYAVLGTAVAGILVSAPAAQATTSSKAPNRAAAVPVSCANMVNPVNATSTSTPRQATLPRSQTLQLRSGYINGAQYAWTRLQNSNSGDRIWIDISGNGGADWIQCDLRTLGSGRNYGNALRTSSSSEVCMRAGARPAGASSSYLTDWWC